METKNNIDTGIEKTIDWWKKNIKEYFKKLEVIIYSAVYDGYPFIKVSIDKVQLPDGKIIDDYHCIEVHNAVMLLVETLKESYYL